MTPERHERLMACFEEACDLDAEAQAAFVERVAAEDQALARELASLLRHDRAAPDTLDAFAAGLPSAGVTGLVAPEITAAPAAGPGAGQLLPGLPDLEVVATLGEGGMGRVLLARQRSLEREVAIKVVRPDVVSEHLAEGLFAEARLAGSLEHPNIVPVHLLGQDGQGRPILVMKRVEGVSWRTLLGDPEHPAWAPLLSDGDDRLAANLSILGSVCHALHFAHSRGVIHRDIKPDNVMVGAFGEVYLVDWGVAARLRPPAPGGPAEPHVAAEKMVGTPGFMAPEMARGGIHTVRTDVFLLGATLHHVLTGAPRHAGRNPLAQVVNAAGCRPVAYGPDVPEELAAICNRATHADPAQRFPTVQAFREAIALHLRHRGSVELGDAARERLAQVRALRAGGDGAADARRLEELLTECHFAFHQSLRIWPENPRARAGLNDCLSLMVEHEVARESLARAQALLEQIEEPPLALREQVAALAVKVRERDARAARQLELERSRDWTVAARARTVFFLGVVALIFTVWRVTVRDQRDNPHTIRPLLLAAFTSVIPVGMAVLVVVFRRSVFATAVTRQLVLSVLCLVCTITVNRALHAIAAPSTAAIISTDMMIAATTAAVGAIMLARWLWLFVPLMLAGALLVRIFPAEAGFIFGISALLCFAVGLRASGSLKG